MSKSTRSARAGIRVAFLMAAATLPTLSAMPTRPHGEGARQGRPAVVDGAEEALTSHYAALQEHDTAAAGRRLTQGYFYIAPWGALELRDEILGRYRGAFESGSLRDYRVEIRAVHTGPAGEGARWFRAIVREKYLRETDRKARNAFAEDLLTSGLAVVEDGTWRIRFMQQTWSDETLRKMIPILHAAQPADPEEY